MAGNLYTTETVPQSSWLVVFLPLALMTQEQVEGLREASLLFAIYGKHQTAGTRCINGMPIFMEFATLTKEETDRVCEIEKKLEAL